MKYFTQQWYYDCQKSDIYFDLEVSDEAKDYDEIYFQKLYQERLKEYSKFAFALNMNIEEYADMRYSWSLLKLNYLPINIINLIVDIRVAALGYVTQDVFEKITEFCKNIETQTNKTTDMYEDYYKNIKNIIPERILYPLSRQHDAEINKIGFVKKDFIIKTEQYDGKYLFTFKNAKVQKNIVKMGYLTWVYEEIYLKDDGYQVHILFHNHNPSLSLEKKRKIILSDVIIFAKDIHIENVYE